MYTFEWTLRCIIRDPVRIKSNAGPQSVQVWTQKCILLSGPWGALYVSPLAKSPTQHSKTCKYDSLNPKMYTFKWTLRYVHYTWARSHKVQRWAPKRTSLNPKMYTLKWTMRRIIREPARIKSNAGPQHVQVWTQKCILLSGPCGALYVSPLA